SMYWLRLSHDERNVIVERSVGGSSSDLFLLDSARGVPRPVTSSPWPDNEAIWSPDDKRVGFGSYPKGVGGIYEKLVEGGGPETLLFTSSENKYPNDWSPDGRFVLVMSQNPTNGYDLWLIPMFGDRKPFPFTQMPFDETNGVFSPDGHWIAYT